MKKVFAGCLVFALILCGCTSTKSFVKNPSRLRQINRVAVLPFVCNKQEFGYNIAESLSANLLATRLIILERSQLQLLLDEQNLTIDWNRPWRSIFCRQIAWSRCFDHG